MNLYTYHNEPESLNDYEEAYEKVPIVLWSTMKIRGNRKLIKKHKHIFAKTARTAYHYAVRLRWGRFPEGEDAIVKDGKFSYFYAKDVIKGRFPEGEEAIMNSEYEPEYLSFLKTNGIEI